MQRRQCRTAAPNAHVYPPVYKHAHTCPYTYPCMHLYTCQHTYPSTYRHTYVLTTQVCTHVSTYIDELSMHISNCLHLLDRLLDGDAQLVFDRCDLGRQRIEPGVLDRRP